MNDDIMSNGAPLFKDVDAVHMQALAMAGTKCVSWTTWGKK